MFSSQYPSFYYRTKYSKLQVFFGYTLASAIDVGQEINIGPGEFGKKNKHRALNTRVLCSK